jgi:hypothetical protein
VAAVDHLSGCSKGTSPPNQNIETGVIVTTQAPYAESSTISVDRTAQFAPVVSNAVNPLLVPITFTTGSGRIIIASEIVSL